MHEFTKQNISSALSALRVPESLTAWRAQVPEGLKCFKCPSVLIPF